MSSRRDRPETVAEWLLWAQDRLEALDNPILESRALMGALLGSPNAPWTRGPEILSPEMEETFRTWVGRRRHREPFHFIVGEVPFFGRSFRVGPGVLVPRPETEHLVACALDHMTDRRGEAPVRILDLGAGSGAIILTLLLEVSDAFGVAVEREPAALRFLLENRRRFGLEERLSVIRGSWGEMLGERPFFDLILSNPPYIPTGLLPTLEPEVRDHEPAAALDGGPDGLACYRKILSFAPALLKEEGLLAFEIGADQAHAFRDGGRAMGGSGTGLTGSPAVMRDVSGQDRVIIWKKL
ncbi:MAG: peptide chain release factor N(5)-glutamine methyltransferase [Nitrospirae bacterium]|nr:peptide chain release factor N(5)-glutamine methyltransferase [Nitrospirota bacterium]MCL5285244.1 peptide chain release factor N(5)-glutamine methyltransferase [Nitrospirota bacterium]